MNVTGVDGDVFAESPNLVIDEELEGNRANVRFRDPMPFRVVFTEHRDSLFPAQAGAFAADVELLTPTDIDMRNNARQGTSTLTTQQPFKLGANA